MRVLIVGYGVQGKKRHRVASGAVVGIVDTVAKEAHYKTLVEVPLSSFDVAFLCVPDDEKVPLLLYLLEYQKPTLVEKPLLCADAEQKKKLHQLSQKTLCYTAYNHRFEPHVQKVKALLTERVIGALYAVHLFYGNGTAADVRVSPWRDKGRGVMVDLGAHLLDLICYWVPDFSQRQFEPVVNTCFENQTADYAILHSPGKPYAHLTMTLLSWKNTFLADLWGEKGSIHIDGLCKWGPSHFCVRHRQYPSGKPKEEKISLTEPDHTWREEHQHFLSLIQSGASNLEHDLWIEQQL